MSDIVYSEGLVEEQKVTVDLCQKYIDKLSPRGVTAERLAFYTTSVKDMELKRAQAGEADTNQQTLTVQEAAKRTALLESIASINKAVKKKFPIGDPVRRRFHIGDVHGNSTTVVVGWARDIVNIYPDYKNDLAVNGVVQADIDALAAEADALEKLNADQTAAVNLTPDANKAFNDAVIAVTVIADSIQTSAGLEFQKDKQTLAKFEAAKQLRFQAPPRKAKPDPNPDKETATKDSSKPDASASGTKPSSQDNAAKS